MALDKLVDSAQLDSDLGDVADAIRAKSGGSSQLAFPAGFVSEIQSIQTGGGAEKVYTKLGEATITEPVHSIYINMTEQMKSCECLYLVLDSIALSEADWLYPNLNGINMAYTPKVTNFTDTVAFAPIKRPAAFTTTKSALVANETSMTSGRLPILGVLTKIGVTTYTSTITITSGKIEVWGYV